MRPIRNPFELLWASFQRLTVIGVLSAALAPHSNWRCRAAFRVIFKLANLKLKGRSQLERQHRRLAEQCCAPKAIRLAISINYLSADRIDEATENNWNIFVCRFLGRIRHVCAAAAAIRLDIRSPSLAVAAAIRSR